MFFVSVFLSLVGILVVSLLFSFVVLLSQDTRHVYQSVVCLYLSVMLILASFFCFILFFIFFSHFFSCFVILFYNRLIYLFDSAHTRARDPATDYQARAKLSALLSCSPKRKKKTLKQTAMTRSCFLLSWQLCLPRTGLVLLRRTCIRPLAIPNTTHPNQYSRARMWANRRGKVDLGFKLCSVD